MITRNFIAAAVFGLLATSFGATVRAQNAEKNEPEVLARGPVHEAFAEPHDADPQASPVVQKAPPAAIEELPPDQKPEGDNVQWLPGYWSWDDERKDFIWISGFWRNPPPNHVWVAGSWRKIGEGYQWVPGFWRGVEAAPAQGQPQAQAQIDYLPQPPASLETGPAFAAPSEDSIYVPGTWIYRDRYVWRPGYYIEHRPGLVWVPAHYRWTPVGYIFIAGYWDHALANRGMLFAPVYISPAVYVQPRYVYTPTIVVQEQCMVGALFVRRGYSSYYFGDYFGPRYVETGFTAWCGGGVSVGFTVQRGFYDPLFSYYSVTYRRDPYWGGGGISELYVGRYRGTIPPPPRTLVQQTTVINNINVTNVNNVNNTTVNNVTRTNQVNQATMLQPLSQVQQNKQVKLQTITPQAREEQARGAKQLQEVAKQRTVSETQLSAKSPNGVSATEKRSISLDLPKQAVARAQSPEHAAPPPPVTVHPSSANQPKLDPKLPPTQPKIDPNHPLVSPPSQPKVDPKLPPPASPKADPSHPLVSPPNQPKVDPKVDITNQPKLPPPLPPAQPKVDPKLPPAMPKSDPKLPMTTPPVSPKLDIGNQPKLPPPLPPTQPKTDPNTLQPPTTIEPGPRVTPPPMLNPVQALTNPKQPPPPPPKTPPKAPPKNPPPKSQQKAPPQAQPKAAAKVQAKAAPPVPPKVQVKMPRKNK